MKLSEKLILEREGRLVVRKQQCKADYHVVRVMLVVACKLLHESCKYIVILLTPATQIYVQKRIVAQSLEWLFKLLATKFQGIHIRKILCL